MNIDVKVTLSPANMKLLGLKAIQMIKARTAEGKGADGDFKKYSEKWFARPVGGITQRVLKALKGLDEAQVKWFMKGEKRHWLAFKGYHDYKKIAFADEFDGGKPNLRATGDMMDGFTVIATDGNSVTLGWIDPELAERAAFNEMRGRSILGLTEAEKSELEAFAAERVEIN